MLSLGIAADNQQKTLQPKLSGEVFFALLHFLYSEVERRRNMGCSVDRKKHLRSQILAAAHEYSSHLAGRVFLYVSGEDHFEVNFKTECFMHLTGVNSPLSAKDFYRKALDGTLSTGQIFFDAAHPYTNAKKKLTCLRSLPLLTNSLVCIMRDFQTITVTYKIGVTNLDFTIGLVEDTDRAGNTVNNWLVPRTLRIKDKAIENSAHAEFVDCILSRDAACSLYSTVEFSSGDNIITTHIQPMLSVEVFESLSIV